MNLLRLAALAAVLATSSGCSILADMVGLKHPAERRAYIEEHRGERPDVILDNMAKKKFTIGMTLEEAHHTSELLQRELDRSDGRALYSVPGLFLHFRDGRLVSFTRTR